MAYFETTIFDLLKLGQAIQRPVSRMSFARHVVDLASKLAQQARNIDDLNRARELLHDQIAGLSWKSFLWLVPIHSYRMDWAIYPVTGYESVLPDSLLGTALTYCTVLNSQDSESQYYARLMVRTGLEWACQKAFYEGRPNVHNDMPELDRERLSAQLSVMHVSA